MSSKNYVIGRRFEYRVQNYLRKKGYYVIRAYGSKGIYDLIAVPPYHDEVNSRFTLGIQCKTNGYMPPKEKERFREVQDKWCLWSILAYREKRKLIFQDMKTDERLSI